MFSDEKTARDTAIDASITRAARFRHTAVLLVRLADGHFDYHGLNLCQPKWPEIGEIRHDGSVVLDRYFNGSSF